MSSSASTSVAAQPRTAAQPGTAVSPDVGQYLYAIVSAERTLADDAPAGLQEAHVYAVVEGAVAAVVSDIPDQSIRPRRRHLAAHQTVLKHLMEQETPLPMAFGTIADDREAVRRILRDNQAAFIEQLRRFQGAIEMGLRVRWDVPNIFEYFLNTHPSLATLRDQLFRPDREPSQPEKIELGRAFERALNEDRQAHTAAVTEVLQPLCSELQINTPRDEQEVMYLACLVPRSGQQAFENGVFEAAARFDNNYTFDYNGPWPPYNFVDGGIRL